ncbi:hypothetical protein A3B45_03155 [Candidatus Daviesbacteria bacterium RIFCSPLOWO2_01_FULL_39_12]|uniref:Peptidase S1 domain-containing protein n=1 Tax=Candidatus Daviesbacteria bacterium RIFCSPLOWO2_01_FULL_39_12 TaxID=1797785 RepID=A0A1F5KSX2_9BACT|nr:MAG: hypothetical protein A3D79_00315 [Candidatus Daviesbacteria bacterium RIFCSPHIGHO2_02_FULL_39_8]OGE44016.1 MAG: hypothetical protein A3B45_03155 [Candidatus Daviesbacteria bacterium RIFCSPLOWO2_01_FULL_39_12]
MNEHIKHARGVIVSTMLGAGILFSGPDDGSVAISRYTPEPQVTPILPPVYGLTPQVEIRNDLYLSSLYNASSLKFKIRGDPYPFGSGFLVEEDGELRIYTAGHVVDYMELVEKDKTIIFTFSRLPQQELGKIDINDFKYQPRTSKQDSIRYLSLDEEFTAVMEHYINQGFVTSLRISQDQPTRGEEWASVNSDWKVFNSSKFIGRNPFNDLLQVNAVEGYACPGDSGGAILKVENGQVTGKVVGVHWGVNKNDIIDPKGLNRECGSGSNVFAIPVQ